MKNRFNHPWTAIAIAIVAITSLIMLFNEQTPLPGYTGKDPEPTTTSETSISVETENYTDEKTGFSVEIPKGWSKVIKSGHTTFVHAPSASSIQIQVLDYYPQVNSASEGSISSELIANNAELVNFYWNDNSSYVVMYRKQASESSINNFVEVTNFDRDNVVKVVYTVNEKNYSKLEKELTYSIDSIQWEKPNPIPENLMLAYSDFGNFEYATPIGWTAGFVDGAYFAQDETSGASMTVTAHESDATYDGVSQLDYVGFVSSGRPNFVLRSYSADKNIIYGTATYMAGDIQMMMVQYMLANGKHEFSITFECPAESYQAMTPMIESAIDLFRIF